jgi:hypothetical protein
LLKYEHSRKRWQERFAVADGRFLKLFTDSSRSQLRTIVDLVDIMLPDEGEKSISSPRSSTNNNPTRFELRQQKGKPLRLQAASAEEVKSWLATISQLRKQARFTANDGTKSTGQPSIMPNSMPLMTLMSEPVLSKVEACNLYIGLLEVTVIEALNLQPADGIVGRSDPYVVSSLSGYYQCFGDEQNRLATEWCKELQRDHTTKWVYRR